MCWSFALINGRLAEVYFRKTKKGINFYAHAWVKKSEYKTKKEQSYIEKDTKKVKLKYRNGKYEQIES